MEANINAHGRIRRVGAAQIQRAVEVINEQRADNQALQQAVRPGGIAEAHLARRLARFPGEEGMPIDMPDNFAFRQAVHLDQFPNNGANENDLQPIRCKLVIRDGPEVTLWISVDEMRRVLRAPNVNDVQDNLLQNFQLPDDNNVPDEDHQDN
jgi:hypothetical protein